VGKLPFIKPMMPMLVANPPQGEGWTHEIKYDGYRTELIIDDGQARAFTRNGHDWTKRYRSIVEVAAALPVGDAIIDGEMVVQDESGVSDFQALRGAIGGEPHRLIFFAFDLLHLEVSTPEQRCIGGPEQ
jgi:bifunctional non-homologous end joining protein LigD